MKIIVIGGMELGANFSIEMKKNDSSAEIIIFDKADHIFYSVSGLPYALSKTIKKEALFKHDKDFLFNEYGIIVKLGYEIIEIDLERRVVIVKNLKTHLVTEEIYQKLILATGSSAEKYKLIGHEKNSNIYSLRTYDELLEIEQKINNLNKVVIIGATAFAIEIAINLLKLNKEIIIINKFDTILRLESEISRFAEYELSRLGIKLISNETITEINTLKKVISMSSTREIKYDIIFSTNTQPNTNFIRSSDIEVDKFGIVITNDFLQTNDKDVYAGGDIVNIPSILTNIDMYIPSIINTRNHAKQIADNIAFGNAIKKNSNILVSIGNINDIFFGRVGITIAESVELGFDVDVAMARCLGLDDYQPNNYSIRAILIYDKKSELILGFQIIGKNTDKIIDFMSLALAKKTKIRELKEINLSYTPSHLNINNVLTRLVEVATKQIDYEYKTILPVEVPPNSLVIDVRESKEFEKSTLPNAINLHYNEFDELNLPINKDKEVYLFCNSGYQSTLAATKLIDKGYNNVYNLRGGNDWYRINKLLKK